MASTTTGTAPAAPIQLRRVMSASSGLGPAAAVISAGSNAMPQNGQAPGPSCRTSGCIGQVKIVPGAASTSLIGAGAR